MTQESHHQLVMDTRGVGEGSGAIRAALRPEEFSPSTRLHLAIAIHPYLYPPLSRPHLSLHPQPSDPEMMRSITRNGTDFPVDFCNFRLNGSVLRKSQDGLSIPTDLRKISLSFTLFYFNSFNTSRFPVLYLLYKSQTATASTPNRSSSYDSTSLYSSYSLLTHMRCTSRLYAPQYSAFPFDHSSPTSKLERVLTSAPSRFLLVGLISFSKPFVLLVDTETIHRTSTSFRLCAQVNLVRFTLQLSLGHLPPGYFDLNTETMPGLCQVSGNYADLQLCLSEFIHPYTSLSTPKLCDFRPSRQFESRARASIRLKVLILTHILVLSCYDTLATSSTSSPYLSLIPTLAVACSDQPQSLPTRASPSFVFNFLFAVGIVRTDSRLSERVGERSAAVTLSGPRRRVAARLRSFHPRPTSFRRWAVYQCEFGACRTGRRGGDVEVDGKWCWRGGRRRRALDGHENGDRIERAAGTNHEDGRVLEQGARFLAVRAAAARERDRWGSALERAVAKLESVAAGLRSVVEGVEVVEGGGGGVVAYGTGVDGRTKWGGGQRELAADEVDVTSAGQRRRRMAGLTAESMQRRACGVPGEGRGDEKSGRGQAFVIDDVATKTFASGRGGGRWGGGGCGVDEEGGGLDDGARYKLDGVALGGGLALRRRETRRGGVTERGEQGGGRVLTAGRDGASQGQVKDGERSAEQAGTNKPQPNATVATHLFPFPT
ncbi:hypothetical protein R3P38DRAFT_2762238 [Favolaschia claudopus]|uniref:Uncharacterized protein n=1 Tax=Favolaschia claudopus TaxID=2862362 RepID=A0AAW0DFS5_9AGAR